MRAVLTLLWSCCAVAWQPLAPSQAWPWQLPRSRPVVMADAFVLERLASIKAAYDELGAKLEDPDIMANTEELLRVTKERAKLEPTVEAFDNYRSLEQTLAEAKELFAEAGDDPEMREMAREEQRSTEVEMATLDEQLKLLLLPTDPNDEKNVRVHVACAACASHRSRALH